MKFYFLKSVIRNYFYELFFENYLYKKNISETLCHDQPDKTRHLKAA